MSGVSRLNVLLIGFGLFLLVASLYAAWHVRSSVRKLQKTLQPLGSESLAETWDILTALIPVFIAGYLSYLLILLQNESMIDPYILVSTVFMLGAVFIFIVAYSNRKAFSRFE